MDAHQQQVVGAALAAHDGVAGALLPILHQVQARLGFIPTTAVPQIARALNLSTAQVHGVLSFYHFFAPSRWLPNIIFNSVSLRRAKRAAR